MAFLDSMPSHRWGRSPKKVSSTGGRRLAVCFCLKIGCGCRESASDDTAIRVPIRNVAEENVEQPVFSLIRLMAE
jgi:hypothetical protein